jgi:hypothetical protein
MSKMVNKAAIADGIQWKGEKTIIARNDVYLIIFFL